MIQQAQFIKILPIHKNALSQQFINQQLLVFSLFFNLVHVLYIFFTKLFFSDNISVQDQNQIHCISLGLYIMQHQQLLTPKGQSKPKIHDFIFKSTHNQYQLKVLQKQQITNGLSFKQLTDSCEKQLSDNLNQNQIQLSSSQETQEIMDKVQSMHKIDRYQSQQGPSHKKLLQNSQQQQTKATSNEKNTGKNNQKNEISDLQIKKQPNMQRSMTKYQMKESRKYTRNLSPARFTSYKIKSIFGPKTIESGPLTGKQLECDAKILLKGNLVKTKLLVCKDILAFIEISFCISEIEKIKILPINAENQQKLWLKIQINSFPYFFHVINKPLQQLQLTYDVFSLVLNKKLNAYEQLQNFSQEHKMPLDGSITFNSWIYGNIYKKSQIMGKWVKRFIVVKHNGIFSYKNPHLPENPSFSIHQKSIKYIWTRFQILYQNYLIIKIKYGVQKTQLAIPLTNFYRRNKSNWLYHICKLLQQY